MKPSIKTMGIVFICIGLIAMTLGISLEIITYWIAERRNESYEASEIENSPTHGLYWYLSREKSS